MFDRLTKDIDERAEVKKGNAAVTTVLAGVLIASFVISSAVSGISNALNPGTFGSLN